MIKLNLGSSNYPEEGYINIDINPGMRPDKVLDLELPIDVEFNDESVGEIRAMHLLEHIRPNKVERVVKSWYNILQPDGQLIIEVPDMDGIVQAWHDVTDDKHRLLAYIYGDNSDEHNHHYWGYNEASLYKLLRDVGFTKIQFEEPQSTRDEQHLVLRVVATK